MTAIYRRIYVAITRLVVARGGVTHQTAMDALERATRTREKAETP